MLTVIDSDRVIATCWLTNDGRRIFVHHMAVHPEFQGKGVSNLLMDRAIEIGKMEKMQLKLEVHKSNIAANNLYKKFGFTYIDGYQLMIKRN